MEMEIETIITGFNEACEKINEKLNTLENIENTQEYKKYNESYTNICKTLTLYDEKCTHMNKYFLEECVQLILQRACDIPGMPKYKKNMEIKLL